MTRDRSENTAPPLRTPDAEYAERLAGLERKRWRRIFDVQAPYRWNIRRLRPGFVLDVGCGLGRNLGHLDGHGVGVDHNPAAVAIARQRSLEAMTPDEFADSPFARPGRFDSLLLAHVVEHLPLPEARDLLARYLPFVRPGGKVIVICPQRAGFRSDPTHVTYFDIDSLRALSATVGLRVESVRSFPFPRVVGRVFPYNEFVLLATKPQ
jgi:SAM-dependent methyltransferase